MATTSVIKVERYSVVVQDEPGQGAAVLAGLAAGKADLLAVWGYPLQGGAKIEIIPADSVAFKAAAKAAKIKVKKESAAFLVEGRSKVGALAEVMKALAEANINAEAVQAVKVGSKYGALVEVAGKDARKAAKALGV
jgi:hypothetical protein